MLSDKVQIVSPVVEPENWHLITPFFNFEALCFYKHLHIVRHKRCSYLGPDVFPTSIQLFHKLEDQLRGVSFTDVGRFSFKGVTNAHRDWYVCVFDREHVCRLLPLILISVCFEVIQYRVWVSSHLGPWQLNIYFSYFTRPCLNYVIASSSERFCAFCSCFEPVFSCLVIASNDFITIIRVTFSASVLVTSVVLKNSPRFMVVPVDRSALNPSLAAVPTYRVVNVNFPPCRFLFEPSKRFWRS